MLVEGKEEKAATPPKQAKLRNDKKFENANDCLPLQDFGKLKENGVPGILIRILPSLAKALNTEKWPQLIRTAFDEGYSSPDEMRQLFKRDPSKYSMRQRLLIFFWFFRGVTNCNGKRRFIERAKDERNGMWSFEFISVTNNEHY